MNSDSIPIDLIIEIFSRLPVKSITRFRCVSKLWSSILVRLYFKQLFLTRSSDHPRLLFAIQEKVMWRFFSLPQHHNSSSSLSSSVVVAAEFHMKFPPDNMPINPSSEGGYYICSYASGLVYLHDVTLIKKKYYLGSAICNPNTGQYAILPYLKRSTGSRRFFVFEPIDKIFKVLCMSLDSIFGQDHHKILTLGTGEMKWRNIKCSLIHEIINSEEICINGVLYYFGDTSFFVNIDADYETSDSVIVCFDVRDEKFKFIDVEVEGSCKLINYKGKLGIVYLEDDGNLRLLILEDVEKQEWSKYAYTLRDVGKFFRHSYSVIGVTASGEIVLSMNEFTSFQPFYVFYFNPERNFLQRVKIQGFGEYYHEGFKNHRVYTFVNHVEDLNNYDSMLFKSSINASYVKQESSEEEEEEDH